ncbi:MAG: hypothetical protein JW923_03200, partial [Spirochaetales bacterium]|nr:hypothetical protein [Spirochaetales bacterium]
MTTKTTKLSFVETRYMQVKKCNSRVSARLIGTLGAVCLALTLEIALQWIYGEIVNRNETWLYEHWSPFVWDNYDFLREL